ncbi:HEAT repeat domain-containing protein [Salmonella enterica]
MKKSSVPSSKNICSTNWNHYPIANTFLFEMMKSKSKDVTLAAIYALGEGRCQAENITRELHRLSQSDDMEIKIAAIKALGRIYR